MSRPRMKTCSTPVENSNGSPLQMTTSATFPASNEPYRSATPKTSAGVSVTERKACSHVIPLATALPACWRKSRVFSVVVSIRATFAPPFASSAARSEEHTSELQSQSNLVCRLLLEKKKNKCRQYPFLFSSVLLHSAHV